MTAPRIDTLQRRARLVARHHLDRSAADVEEAMRAVVAMHSSDPITPYLGAWARVPGFETLALDQALLQHKGLWRLHAMRRTLFIVATEHAPSFFAAAACDIAAKERRRVEKWIAPELDVSSVSRWLSRLEKRILAALEDGSELRTSDLSKAIPALGTPVTLGSGKWSRRAPIASRLLFLMAMDGLIVRTRSAGSWRSSQYAWASTTSWFGGPLETPDLRRSRAAVVQRYLEGHSPVTQLDVKWWTGWSHKLTKQALVDCEAQPVTLDGGGEGYVASGDEHVSGRPRSVALLPGLDPAPMGYKERDWFLGDHQAALFDRNGNVGPSIWLDGRIVGGWGQREDGAVVYRLLEDVGKRDAGRVAKEVATLQAWLGDAIVTPRFRTPLEKELTSGA